MRIGLPDTLRFARYGPYWEKFITALDSTPVRPVRPLEEALSIGVKALPREPLTVQLFVGRLMELLATTDHLVLPDLNPNSEPSTFGAAGDPWQVDLPSILAERFTLPSFSRAPLHASVEEIEGAAVQLGAKAARQPQLVRRALERAELQLRVEAQPHLDLDAPGLISVALVADPALLEAPLLAVHALQAILNQGLYCLPITVVPFAQAAKEAGGLLKRARRVLLPTELEMAGGAASLVRRGSVRGVVFITQPDADATNEALLEIAQAVTKPTVTLHLTRNLSFSREDTGRLTAFAQGLGSRPRPPLPSGREENRNPFANPQGEASAPEPDDSPVIPDEAPPWES